MYSFASGTILSAGTCSPSLPGTQPVSLNISPASFRRAISSLLMAFLMIASLSLCARRERPRRSRTVKCSDEFAPSPDDHLADLFRPIHNSKHVIAASSTSEASPQTDE